MRVVFEDADLLVVDKPAGLLTVATDRERTRTLYAGIRALLARRRPPERVFVVHRLDREASGLLVFAKTPEAKYALQGQFKTREAGRTYVALVRGTVARDELTLRSHLAENAALRVWDAGPQRGGKLAVSHVRVRARRGDHTLVEVTLETGRKHQIRVQLADAGHPILGDRRYGPRERDAPGLALHAAVLRLRHPSSGEKLVLRSPPPRWFRVQRPRRERTE
jgi:23S rRNA pseudouridine1911/1915/1917 synthase